MNRVLNKLQYIFSAGVVFTSLFFVPQAYAQEEVVCNVIYGQGEVCRVEREGEVLGAHAPVGAGIGDISFINIALVIGLTGAMLLALGKLTKRVYLLEK